MKKEFGEFGVLILDRQTFFERVQTAICESSQNTQFTMGFVEYMPEEQHQGFIEWGPFTKKEKFNYQNEFRFTFVSDDTKPNTIDLGGSIRDIAVPIMMDDLNEIHFENGNLLYPMYRENHPLGNHITDNVPQP